MEKIEQYRQFIKEILTEYSQHQSPYGDIQSELIFDSEGDRYQLIRVGWLKNDRVYGSTIHIDIINGKIWIQNDNTEEGIANILVAKGVSKQDIVLAYQSPFLRQFSDFAVS